MCTFCRNPGLGYNTFPLPHSGEVGGIVEELKALLSVADESWPSTFVVGGVQKDPGGNQKMPAVTSSQNGVGGWW